MKIINITNPDVEPVQGDTVRYEYLNGMTETKTYHEPVVSSDEPLSTPILTKIEFLDKFKFTELVAIETAAEISATIRVLKQYLDAATIVDLESTNIQIFIATLVTSGLLTQARADEILI